MDVRNQLKAWISTRYGWPLADVGYVLSGESVAGVAVLLALSWLDRVPCHAPSVSFAVREKRKRELLVARASLSLGAAGALVIALAAERTVFVLGLVVMMGTVGFPDAVRAFCTSFFAGDEIQPLYAAATVVEMLGGIIGSPVWGWIFTQAYHGASIWMGVPFATLGEITQTEKKK
ncbi:MAG: hypothetical protein LQ351_004667 [Letrouitia transgressa]|nr:MAG: hypothetical protein LQ351_004667 [Letrouitia transgressa]